MSELMVCGSCYTMGAPKKGGITGGVAVAVFLLFGLGALFVPRFMIGMYVFGGLVGLIVLGAIASAVAGRVCTRCGGKDLVPAGTPRAGEIAAKAKAAGHEVAEVRITAPEGMSPLARFALAVVIALVVLMGYVAIRSRTMH